MARQTSSARAASTLFRQASGGDTGMGAGSSSGGGGGGGGDSDSVYDEVLRRMREEREQLGQLIDHPF